MEMALDENDKFALDSLEKKQNHLRTAVLSLVTEYQTGLFVHGEGGTGKSYIVQQELDKLKASYVIHNSRITARGLVDELEANPTAIHWIEDAETLLDDKNSFGVLRSACWSQDNQKPMRREITWTAFKTQIRFWFTGAILVVSNQNMVNTSPELRAVKTRVRVMNMDVTKKEAFALMKTICAKGYTYGKETLSPEQCWEVAEFIFDNLSELKRPLDLRLLKHGFNYSLLEKEHKTALSWQEQLESMMNEAPVAYKSRKVQSHDERQVALRIYGQGGKTQAQMVAEWKAETGKGKASFYRALIRKAS